MKYKVVSLFSGAGGLDLGFSKAGFEICWANDIDKNVWDTYDKNHKNKIKRGDLTKVKAEEIPNCDVLIGGPPCQSWSIAGNLKGLDDPRGKLVYEYLRILNGKKPKVFLMENVAGMISKKHIDSFKDLIKKFEKSGYKVSYKLLNAKDYDVPQDRKRIIVVGVREDIKFKYEFPTGKKEIKLKDSIFDISEFAIPAQKNKTNGKLKILNHEYYVGSYSSQYMSRNRVRTWDEVSFTIQASGRQAPLHPSAPKMVKIEKDKMKFVDKKEELYRRLSVREVARIQTFPDDFEFVYDSVEIGYKMIGNAVPVNLAYSLANAIKELLDKS